MFKKVIINSFQFKITFSGMVLDSNLFESTFFSCITTLENFHKQSLDDDDDRRELNELRCGF